MPGIKLDQYGGMLPAWDDHLLPAGQAANSVNGYLFSGALNGWRTPKLLRTLLNSAAKYVYRVPTVTQAAASDTLTVLGVPHEGDTVTLGEMTYKFTATVTNAFDVLIGATAAISAQNLLDALTADNGLSTNAGVLYGTDTSANTALDLSGALKNPTTFAPNTINGAVIYVQAADYGEAYNTLAVAESTSGARFSWATPYFTGGINPNFDSSITGAATWLEFADPDTNVLRSPVVDDQYDRYYFASPSLPPQYNTHARISAGQAPWLLGVPAPGCEPMVSVTGGGDSAQLGFPNSISTNSATPGGNMLILTPVTPTGAMTLNEVSLMPLALSTTANFAAVVYDDNNGTPGQLLNTGAIVTGCQISVALSSQFVNPTGLLMDTQYWIGFLMDTAIPIALADDNANAGNGAQAATWTNGPPGEAPAMAGGQPDWQMWGDLTTSSVIEARAYVYTWITEYGEEGPPSPPTLVNGWDNGTWTVDTFGPPPDDMGVARNLKTIRLYRTVSGATGQTVFFWVCDIDIATGAVTLSNNNTVSVTGGTNGTVVAGSPAGQVIDTLSDVVVAFNLQMPSTLWFPPPEGLLGIVAMPNGMTVGFKGNEVWFSEPYFPHAWPPSYVVTTEFPIVGLGVTGQTLVVCTSGTPYTLTGVNPANMALSKSALKEPCSSRGSILGGDTGVYYTSLNGLILVTSFGQATNTTELWITRENWAKLTPPMSTRAILLASSYFAYGSVTNGVDTYAQQGFTIELNPSDAQSFSIWPQPGGHRLGFNSLGSPNGFDIQNVLTDPWTGIGLLVQNGGVYYFDFTDEAPLIQPYTWRSKIYQQKAKANLSAMRVFFTVPPNTPTQSAKRQELETDDPAWNTLATGQYGIVRVFADGNLVTVRELRKSGELLRIISGYKVEQWQFELNARVLISNMQVAPTVHELGDV
jgi:hypothetical protein